MELLRSEVRLLLIRNSQLEEENNELRGRERERHSSLQRLERLVSCERQLSAVLEAMKASQSEYIDLLNDLIVMLTVDNEQYSQLNDSQRQYATTKNAINNCIQVCQRLQRQYETCVHKRNANTKHAKQAYTSNNTSLHTQPTHDAADDADGHHSSLIDHINVYNHSLMSLDSMSSNKTNIFSRLEEKFYPRKCGVTSMDDSNVDSIVAADVMSDSERCVDQMEEEDEDSDPNGAGEQYIDVTDKEFLPKRSLFKTARKTLNVSLTSRLSKSARKGFKSSQKVGDKFRCNWKGCTFISSYKQNVERHYRVHTGEKPFKCSFKGCNFSASQAGNLKVHQERHGHLSPNGHNGKIKCKTLTSKHSPHSPSNTANK